MLQTMGRVILRPAPISKEVLRELDRQGLIKLFAPTSRAQEPPPGENVADSLYESAEAHGPHKLIAVGVNKTQVRLGVHPDNEEFLIPDHGTEVRPLYLVIAHLDRQELVERDRMGTLADEHFTCLSLYPCPRGAEMFTMPAGTVHCEVTVEGDAPVGCFYVTEARDIPIAWVDLERTQFEIG